MMARDDGMWRRYGGCGLLINTQ